LSRTVPDHPRVLVAIANYGEGNRRYLDQLLAEYRAMPFPVDVVVLSNIPKDLGDDVEVKVGLPGKDPWSLPFGHKQLFADRIEQYDAFIYSEDDILVTENNIRAFLEVTPKLEDDEIAMEPGTMLVAPSGVPHGVRNTGGERLVLLAILAPGPGAA